jgi:RNA polymerase sigma factor (sigma-70 family)
LSDVFLDVWQQATRFEARASVSTWLLAIARYKALSARRRRTNAELNEKVESTVADPADDPEVVLEKKNRGELLRQALTNLSRVHSEVIDLAYYQVGQRGRGDRRDRRGHGQDAHVLCAQEIGRDGQGGGIATYCERGSSNVC